MTALRAAISTATVALTAAGVGSPEHDARALAVHVLGVARPSDLGLFDDFPTAAVAAEFRRLVARRVERVPLQHLTGSVGFRFLELAVGPGVFVPRPETESVVQWAVDTLRTAGWSAPLLVDLCTGSGTIAFALANEVPGAVVHGVERDPAALAWTRRNAADRVRAGDPEVTLHLGSALDALPELDGTVHLLASNPPYVAEDEAAGLDPEVGVHDPTFALFAGGDGLAVIREVERAGRRLLRRGGFLVVEHSDRQGRSCPQVFLAAGGWTQVQDHRDLAGRDRFTTACWDPPAVDPQPTADPATTSLEAPR